MDTCATTATIGTDELLMVRRGGRDALADLFSRYRSRLERMVDFRLDPRLVGRVDPEDVLQEAYIEVARRIDDFLVAPRVSLFVWIRQITWQTLLAAHRRHLAQKRNAGQEVSLAGPRDGSATSLSLASRLAGHWTTPSQAAIRDERLVMLRRAIDHLDGVDREVLALRHFEQLGNAEVAEILGISKTAASNRYVRAIKRLTDYLDAVTPLRDELNHAG